MTAIRVMLVDDHALFRNGLASLIRSNEEFELVGESSNGIEALERVRECTPDIVLMDINMPKMNGIEASRRIKKSYSGVKIVMLTASEEEENLFEAIKCGAQGYLLKAIEPAAFFRVLKGVMRGEAPISRTTATKILGELRRVQQSPAGKVPEEALTNREQEILEVLAGGASNKEIAASLGISENTVKNHLKNILEKLHLKNRVEAAAYALREGLDQGSRPKGHRRL